jgi:hypothetical protein
MLLFLSVFVRFLVVHEIHGEDGDVHGYIPRLEFGDHARNTEQLPTDCLHKQYGEAGDLLSWTPALGTCFTYLFFGLSMTVLVYGIFVLRKVKREEKSMPTWSTENGKEEIDKRSGAKA